MQDNRKTALLVLVLAAMLFSLLTVFAAGSGRAKTSAKAAILYRADTGEVLYESNSEARLPMASTTKIMTALIALERCDLRSEVTIPREAAGIEGSSVYLKEGDVLTVRDLIYSVLLQSANDAATALAYEISGDIRGFTDLMNERALSLGALDTHFDNPHGLDSPEHYTTARDLAIITAAALENDLFRKICSTYKYEFFEDYITAEVYRDGLKLHESKCFFAESCISGSAERTPA